MSDKKSAIKVLNGAIDILKNNKWTRKENARNIRSEPVLVGDPEAVSFCALGAIYKAYFNQDDKYDSDGAHFAQVELRNYLGCTIATWNDSKVNRKRDVISAMKKCVKGLENEV